jgi:late competence protein required for DNA uptake (superfamily II DNA/RNA helicase)
MDIPTLPGDPVRDCRRCGCRKNEENFTKLKTGKLHSYCKKCLREINKRYSLDRDSVRTGKQYIIDYKDNRGLT